MEKRKGNIIDRYYHLKMQEMEEKEHRRKFKKGKDIRVGRVYRGILTREGVDIDGPLSALSYKKGILLLGKKDLKTFVFLDEDVVEWDGFVYTGGQVNIIRLKERLNSLFQDKTDDTDKASGFLKNKTGMFVKAITKSVRRNKPEYTLGQCYLIICLKLVIFCEVRSIRMSIKPM